ncbi:Prephenate dehydratase-domain-containing protein [Gorgonomyces haynaldii]|nr:Prephenate dehydratase-domain-containing protein [Gorgonomyces haynaldii]
MHSLTHTFLKMTVIGFQGEKGCHSETALLQHQPGVQTKGFTSFQSLLASVSEQLDAIVPVEHSVVGTFFNVLDLIQKHQLHISGEYLATDEHVLAVIPGTKLGDLKEVESHPYVFDQCRAFLDALPSTVKIIQSSDTALSAKNISEQKLKTSGAIVSPQCAKLFGLEVLQPVADNQQAVTRYVLVSKKPKPPQGISESKTSLLVVLKNTTGALAKSCACFSHRDINISKVESRPTSSSISSPWEYKIYFDVDGSIADQRIINAIQNLAEFGHVVVLGSYPRYRQPIKPTLGAYGIGM